MNNSVIDVEIAGVVRVNNLGLNPLDQKFDELYNFQQRHCIQAIVRQLVQVNILHPHSSRRRMGLPMQPGEWIAMRRVALRMPRSDALAQNREMDLATFLYQSGSGSTAAQHLIVWMSRDH
jgi:hypothetical protein